MSRVVLVGAGYTSVWAYRAIVRRMPRAHVTVVTEHPRHSFHGYTSETLAGQIAVGAANSLVTEAFPRARVVIGTVTDVDPEGRTVGVRGGDGTALRLGYDHVVVATGARERLDAVPGMAEHGHALRQEHSLAALRERLRAAPAGTGVAVVGGGLAGVETAAAIARLDPGLRVSLVSGSAPAAEMAGDRGRCERVLDELARTGVRVVVGARATSVDAGGVDLTDGTRVAAEVVVSALGSTARPLPGLQAHARDDGRLSVDRTLAVRPGVWAAGDCAAVPRRESGTGAEERWYPANALHAINAGTRIGRNVVAGLRGRAPREFDYTELGRVATFGRTRAVGSLLGLPLHGTASALVRQVLFLWFIPSRRQALRLLVGRTAPPARADDRDPAVAGA